MPAPACSWCIMLTMVACVDFSTINMIFELVIGIICTPWSAYKANSCSQVRPHRHFDAFSGKGRHHKMHSIT